MGERAELLAREGVRAMARAAAAEWIAGADPEAGAAVDAMIGGSRALIRRAAALRDGGETIAPFSAGRGASPAPRGAIEPGDEGAYQVFDGVAPRARVWGAVDARRVRAWGIAHFRSADVRVFAALPGLRELTLAAERREFDGGLLVALVDVPAEAPAVVELPTATPADEPGPADPAPRQRPAAPETLEERDARVAGVLARINRQYPRAAEPAPVAEPEAIEPATFCPADGDSADDRWDWPDWSVTIPGDDEPAIILKAPSRHEGVRLARALLAVDHEGFAVDPWSIDDELATGLANSWGMAPIASDDQFGGRAPGLVSILAAYDRTAATGAELAARLGFADGGDVAEPSGEIAPAAEPDTVAVAPREVPAEATPPPPVEVPEAPRAVDVGKLPRTPRQDNYDVFQRSAVDGTEVHIARLFRVVGGARTAIVKAQDCVRYVGSIVVRKASRDLADDVARWGGERLVRVGLETVAIAAPLELTEGLSADRADSAPETSSSPAAPPEPAAELAVAADDEATPAKAGAEAPAPAEVPTATPRESWAELTRGGPEGWDITEGMAVVSPSGRAGRVEESLLMADGAHLTLRGPEIGGDEFDQRLFFLGGFNRYGTRYLRPHGADGFEELTVDGPASAVPAVKPMVAWSDEEWAAYEAKRAAERGTDPLIAPMPDEAPAEADPGEGRYLASGDRGNPLFWFEATDEAAALSRSAAARTHGPSWAHAQVRAFRPGEWAELAKTHASLTDTGWEARVPLEPVPARDKPVSTKAADDKHRAAAGGGGGLALFPGDEPAEAPKPKGKAKPPEVVHGLRIYLVNGDFAARARATEMDVRVWGRRAYPTGRVSVLGPVIEADAHEWDHLPELTPTGLVGTPIVAPPEPAAPTLAIAPATVAEPAPAVLPLPAPAASGLPCWVATIPAFEQSVRAVGKATDVRAWAAKQWPSCAVELEPIGPEAYDARTDLLVLTATGFATATPAVAEPDPVPSVPPAGPTPAAGPAPLWEAVIWNLGRCDVVARCEATSADDAHFRTINQFPGLHVAAPKAFLVIPSGSGESGRWTIEGDQAEALATAREDRLGQLAWDVFAQADGGEPQLLGRLESESKAVAVVLAEMRHPEYGGEIFARPSLRLHDFRFAGRPMAIVEVRDGVTCWGAWIFNPTDPATIPAPAPAPRVVEADGSAPSDAAGQLVAALRADGWAASAIDRYQADGASGLEIRAMLGRGFARGEFTDEAGRKCRGGSHELAPGVACCFVGGDAPKFWANKATATGRATLEGAALIDKARSALAIPFEDGAPAPPLPRRGRPSSAETAGTGS